MRLLCTLALTALLWALPVGLGSGGASAFMQAIGPSSAPEGLLVLEAKIVCGDTGDGFKCRNEPGNVRRGKMRKIPGASSGKSYQDPTDAAPDALPPASGGAGTGTPAPRTVPATCPANAELLGGHCIPYTQTCRKGLAANAPPQVCQRAEEKLVCNVRQDSLKDCCCRTYSKF